MAYTKIYCDAVHKQMDRALTAIFGSPSDAPKHSFEPELVEVLNKRVLPHVRLYPDRYPELYREIELATKPKSQRRLLLWAYSGSQMREQLRRSRGENVVYL